jgi:hypothetical protein
MELSGHPSFGPGLVFLETNPYLGVTKHHLTRAESSFVTQEMQGNRVALDQAVISGNYQGVEALHRGWGQRPDRCSHLYLYDTHVNLLGQPQPTLNAFR